MKPIVLSNHAEQRRKQRGLTIQQIELTIRNPEYVKILEDRNVAVKEIMGRTITVVYTEEGSYLRVITVI